VTRPALPELPVSVVLSDVAAALTDAGRAVLVAPPGAGKTTLVPLHLLGEAFMASGKILLVEPRRLAARAAARRAERRGRERRAAVRGSAVRPPRPLPRAERP